eukprot:TRINITY_DN21105_c0_g2_i2.p1 TRINITY_DN21105_c0_g2~~TRINITY_DN21105_c0_g2_i2.p1  ORF type:complete len:135 (+),score=26.09 TRINITY_DN21105_c0_g2_i2:79-483(+)
MALGGDSGSTALAMFLVGSLVDCGPPSERRPVACAADVPNAASTLPAGFAFEAGLAVPSFKAFFSSASRRAPESLYPRVDATASAAGAGEQRQRPESLQQHLLGLLLEPGPRPLVLAPWQELGAPSPAAPLADR